MKPVRYWYAQKKNGEPRYLCRFNVEKACEEALTVRTHELIELETFSDVLEGRMTVITEEQARQLFPEGFKEKQPTPV